MSDTGGHFGLMDYPRAAEYLCISQRKLADLVKRGVVPVVRVDRSVRFRMESLEQWVESMERKAG